MIRITFFAAGLLTMLAGAALAESGFLTDYSNLLLVESQSGTDRIYVAPGAEEGLVNYNAVMVDQPEIHFSADSKYRGLKPEDVQAISAEMRNSLSEKLTAGGYKVVEQPGADVLYMRIALSELYLKKKKRRLMSYTPTGMLLHAGKNALTETLNKVDIIEMTLEAELIDSQSGDVLAAAVIARGARKAKGQKEQRMDIDEFRATINEYSSRFRCRFDNSRVPQSERIDCNDLAARQAREQTAL